MIPEYTVNEYALLFPMMEGKAYDDFKADIAANSLREPVVLWRGQLIDGRNRYKACRELGIAFETEDLPDDTDPLAYVLSKNLHRRQLTESQLAALTVDIANMQRGDNQHTNDSGKEEKYKGSFRANGCIGA
jgi:hypothetical protein